MNIRLMPDSKTEIVGHLNQGESVALVGMQEGWYEVVLEGDATGYISVDWTVVLDENAVNEWYQPVIEEPVEVEAASEPVAQPEPDSGTDRR
ncbi:MAG: SH3 domain-containing protein [Proteobacteria bacterium]|nr:SH3 domain-containing protein [Pseudomonadota bacterium]